MVEYVEKEQKPKVDVWKIKKYVCKVKPIDLYSSKNTIVLNKAEAQQHDIYSGYRTQIKIKDKTYVALVEVSDNHVVSYGEVGIMKNMMDKSISSGAEAEIIHMDRPESISFIKKKLDKGALSDAEIRSIVKDVMEDKLSEAEASAWITAAYINGFTDDEIISLAHATVESGESLNLGKGPILDKHCIGGVAGNRTTMLIVPIIAAAGLYIPKTSSRSITSAAGTADTMEVLANVSFSIDEMRSIVTKAKGCVVWGGGMKLAPVDDRLIKIRHPLSLDPEGMLLASILGKKKSVGANYVLVDIPVGRGVKVPYIERGNELAKHFISVGEKMGMKIEAILTDGAEPVGDGIGPILECMDVLKVLEGNGPDDLRHKAILMAGKLLELSEKVEKGKGMSIAEDLLKSGKALTKFREIIELQGGNGKIKLSDLAPGNYSHTITADVGGSIFHIDNKVMSKIARIAGAPKDKGAGVLLHRLRGDRVERGDKLFTIYAHSESNLSFALKALENLEPIEMRKMLLGTVD